MTPENLALELLFEPKLKFAPAAVRSMLLVTPEPTLKSAFQSNPPLLPAVRSERRVPVPNAAMFEIVSLGLTAPPERVTPPVKVLALASVKFRPAASLVIISPPAPEINPASVGVPPPMSGAAIVAVPLGRINALLKVVLLRPVTIRVVPLFSVTEPEPNAAEVPLGPTVLKVPAVTTVPPV